MSGVIEKALSPVVLLDRFPKAVVDVYVEVMEAGGSELAAAVTTACLALADAGIEMTDLVAAAALVRGGRGGGGILVCGKNQRV